MASRVVIRLVHVDFLVGLASSNTNARIGILHRTVVGSSSLLYGISGCLQVARWSIRLDSDGRDDAAKKMLASIGVAFFR